MAHTFLEMHSHEDYLFELGEFVKTSSLAELRYYAANHMLNLTNRWSDGVPVDQHGESQPESDALTRLLCSAGRVDALFAAALHSANTLLASDKAALKTTIERSCSSAGIATTECLRSPAWYFLMVALGVCDTVVSIKCGAVALAQRSQADILRVCTAAVTVAELAQGLYTIRLADSLCGNAAKVLARVTIHGDWPTSAGLVRAGALPLLLRMLDTQHTYLLDHPCISVCDAFSAVQHIVFHARGALRSPDTAAEAHDTLDAISQLSFYPSMLRAFLHRNAFTRVYYYTRLMDVLTVVAGEPLLENGGWEQLQAEPELIQRALVMLDIIGRMPPREERAQGKPLEMYNPSVFASELRSLLARCLAGAPWPMPRPWKPAARADGRPAACDGKKPISSYRRQVKKEECRSCAACSKVAGPGGPMQRCGRCRVMWYCGPMCQKAHWKEHKRTCVRAAEPDVTAN